MANKNIKEVEGGEVSTVGNDDGMEWDTGVTSVWQKFTSLAAQLATLTQTLTNKTLTAPTIADFTNAAHDHGDADDGGAVVSSSAAVSGVIEIATNAETLTGTDTVRAVTPDDLEYARSLSGWTPDTNTWSYSSADSPTFIISVNADMTAKIGVGNRIKLTQTSAKYFIVTAVGAFGGGATLITVYGGTDYTLANAAISSPFYSRVKAPFGFPTDRAKWTVTTSTTDSPAKSSAASSTWYGGSGLTPTGPSIDLPIGSWRVFYRVVVDFTSNLAAVTNMGCRATLSTANNTESDAELTSGFTNTLPISATALQRATYVSEKVIVVASKTSYFLNVLTGNAAGTGPALTMNPGGVFKNIIKAECTYL